MAKRRVIVEIEGTVQWAAHQDEASGMWVGTCRDLNLTAVGETWAELQEAGNQATGLLFAELHASKELAALAKRLGWKINLTPVGGSPTFDIPTLWEPTETATDLTRAHA